LVLYVFFDNFAEGTVLGIKLGGAVAAYAALLSFGWANTKDAIIVDDLKQQLSETLSRLTLATGKKEEVRLAEVHKEDFNVKAARGRYVGLITGDIRNMKKEGIDVWINTENTNMQMARFYDKNISGTIRYLGAKKNSFNEVEEDIIALELEKALEGRSYVPPATVVVTDAGELQNTHGVKKIFHVASVRGEVGGGYTAIEQLGQCVINAMQKAEDLNSQSEKDKIESMMAPILGAGVGGKSFEEAAQEQIEHAISFFESNPKSDLKHIYLIAPTQSMLESLRRIMSENSNLSK